MNLFRYTQNLTVIKASRYNTERKYLSWDQMPYKKPGIFYKLRLNKSAFT